MVPWVVKFYENILVLLCCDGIRVYDLIAVPKNLTTYEMNLTQSWSWPQDFW